MLLALPTERCLGRRSLALTLLRPGDKLAQPRETAGVKRHHGPQPPGSRSDPCGSRERRRAFCGAETSHAARRTGKGRGERGARMTSGGRWGALKPFHLEQRDPRLCGGTAAVGPAPAGVGEPGGEGLPQHHRQERKRQERLFREEDGARGSLPTALRLSPRRPSARAAGWQSRAGKGRLERRTATGRTRTRSGEYVTRSGGRESREGPRG